MKALAIAVALVSAWISGHVFGDEQSTDRAKNGAAVLVVIAIVCGIFAAWW